MDDIYMRDIVPDKRNSAFFGEGTDELIKEAEKKGIDIIVGSYHKKPYLDE